jgi:hypothetical protein
MMFPHVKACRDVLEVFVEAKAARVNPADVTLQHRIEEANEEHDLQKALLDNLEIEHGFVRPPAQGRSDGDTSIGPLIATSSSADVKLGLDLQI